MGKCWNPYLEEWQRINEVPEEPYTARKVLAKKYAWAVPNDEAIKTLCQYSPLVELGAGTGYWAWQIRQGGGDIVAYDLKPYENHWSSFKWTDVQAGGPKRLRHHRHRTLLLCWPPYSNPMARRALRWWRGRRLVYVGERRGATADDQFDRELEREFTEVLSIEIPQWDGIHDSLMVFERKGGV